MIVPARIEYAHGRCWCRDGHLLRIGDLKKEEGCRVGDQRQENENREQ